MCQGLQPPWKPSPFLHTEKGPRKPVWHCGSVGPLCRPGPGVCPGPQARDPPRPELNTDSAFHRSTFHFINLPRWRCDTLRLKEPPSQKPSALDEKEPLSPSHVCLRTSGVGTTRQHRFLQVAPRSVTGAHTHGAVCSFVPCGGQGA